MARADVDALLLGLLIGVVEGIPQRALMVVDEAVAGGGMCMVLTHGAGISERILAGVGEPTVDMDANESPAIDPLADDAVGEAVRVHVAALRG